MAYYAVYPPFKVGERVLFRRRDGHVGGDPGTVIEVIEDSREGYGTLYKVQWDDGPYPVSYGLLDLTRHKEGE